MSYTTLFIFKDNVVAEEKRYQNSHGSAMAVWMIIGRRHVDPNFQYFSDADWKALWSLSKGTELTWFARTALVATEDNIVFKREDLLKLAEAFELFDQHYAEDWKKSSVFSLPEQAKDIRKAHTGGAQAVAWEQTSLAGCIFNDTDDEAFNLVSTPRGQYFADMDEIVGVAHGAL